MMKTYVEVDLELSDKVAKLARDFGIPQKQLMDAVLIVYLASVRLNKPLRQILELSDELRRAELLGTAVPLPMRPREGQIFIDNSTDKYHIAQVYGEGMLSSRCLCGVPTEKVKQLIEVPAGTNMCKKCARSNV